MTYLPKQRVSLATKRANGFKWAKNTIDHYIGQSRFNKATGKVNDQMLYDYYNGVIHEHEYQHVLNPTNTPAEKLMGNPAQLRNYPIIKPVVDLFMGEKRKRPRNFMVSCINDDAEMIRREAMTAHMAKVAEQRFFNKANELGIPTGVESQELGTDEEELSKFVTKYNDKRTMQGQSLLDYTFAHQKIPRQLQKGWFDFLVTGKVRSYKTLDKGDVLYEIVPASDIDHAVSDTADMIEDTPWQVRRVRLHLSEAVDRFYDKLSETERKKLESGAWNGTLYGGGFTGEMATDVHLGDATSHLKDYAWGENRDNLNSMVTIYHTVWATDDKVGILTYMDEFGQEQKMEVDEDYEFSEEHGDLDIEWLWLTRRWEGWRVEDDFHFGIGPVEIERGELNNLSKSKSPYNGRNYSDRFSDNISIVSLGIPYQKKVNEYNLSLDTTLSKNNDVALLIDISVIPKQKGWDVDKFMYYLKKMGIAFINKAQQGADHSMNQYTALQMSTMQYVMNTYQLIQAFRDEYEELVGITKPRKGQKETDSGLGMMQSSIVSSSNITEELFARYDEFEETEAQGILDYAKWSNLEGKKGEYMTPDERRMFLEIEPETVQEAEYALFAKNSGEEMEQLNMMKQNAVAFAQNNATPATIAKILAAKSMEKLAAMMEEVEKSRAAVEQQQAEQQNQAIVQAQQIQAETAQKQIDKDIYLGHLSSDTTIDVALIKANESLISSASTSVEGDNSGIETLLKERAQMLKEQTEAHKMQMEERKANQKDEEIAVKREQIAAQKAVARINPG